MSLLHKTIPPLGTIGGVGEPQWAEGHVIDSGGITFHDGSTQTSAVAAGLGAAVSFSPSTGTVDPSIAGFTAGLGSAGTGRVNVTLAGATSFEGLPAGSDGQQLQITVIAGNYVLTLLANNVSTAQQQVLASGNPSAALYDSLSLYYDSGLTKWVFIP